MSSSRTITLFAQQTQPTQKPTSFLVSILVHGAVVALVSLGFLYAPRIEYRPSRHYTLDRVDLDSPEFHPRLSGGSSNLYPVTKNAAQASNASGTASALPSSKLLSRQKVDQTLIQPQVKQEQPVIKSLPVPAMLLWTPPAIRVRTATPPPPHPANTADIKPTVEPPNVETRLADVAISSTTFKTRVTLIKPSTTTPVVTHGPETALSIPETSSASATQMQSAAVLSISDVQLSHGTAMLPAVNQVAPGDAAQSSQAGGKSRNGQGMGQGQGGNDPSGQEASAKGNGSQGSSGKGKGAAGQSGSGAGAGTGAGSNKGNGQGDGPEDGRTYSKINLPQNGQFSVVVVGSDLQDEYPETTNVWKGRLAYSVYLHVGMAKTWILQYSQPRNADAAAAGYVSKIEAPWPYYIVRPNLNDDDVNADALMVHGFVNETGHLESLSVVFPPDFTQKQFVLDALRQWQFRPASQIGKPARVEVLLIIPEDGK